jgi:hypothetical protein
VAITRRWPLAHSRDTGSAVDAVISVELLSRKELRRYFPDSRIVTERIGPLVKSIIPVSCRTQCVVTGLPVLS